MHRRHFFSACVASTLAAAVSRPGPARAQTPPVTKPRRLAPNDTVALVAPASATFKTIELDIAKESLEALGLKVKIGGHLLDRYGYLAGQDKDRAEDINRFFADPSIRAVLPIRGGWGSSRLLPFLDFDVIRRNPKVVLGYSDITALLLSIHAKTGLVTFHGPNGMGRWDEFSVGWVRQILFEGRAVTLEEIFEDHVKPLKVPAWQGAMIGHRMPQFTIGEGIQVEIDATAGRITMLEAAVVI